MDEIVLNAELKSIKQHPDVTVVVLQMCEAWNLLNVKFGQSTLCSRWSQLVELCEPVEVVESVSLS